MWNPSRSLKLALYLQKQRGVLVYPWLCSRVRVPLFQSIGLCFPLLCHNSPSMPTVCVCPVLCDSRDCGPSASLSVGVFLSKSNGAVAISPPGDRPHQDQTRISALTGGFLPLRPLGSPAYLWSPTVCGASCYTWQVFAYSFCTNCLRSMLSSSSDRWPTEVWGELCPRSQSWAEERDWHLASFPFKYSAFLKCKPRLFSLVLYFLTWSTGCFHQV